MEMNFKMEWMVKNDFELVFMLLAIFMIPFEIYFYLIFDVDRCVIDLHT